MLKYSSMFLILAMFIIAYLGYIIFRALHIPSPALIGPIVMVAIFSGLGMPTVAVSSVVKTGLQSIIGIMIGLRFNRERLGELKYLLIPGIITTTWMISTGLIIGLSLIKLTNLDAITAFFASSPGGVLEMSMFAMVYDLNVPIVAVLQFMRIVVTYLTFPILVNWVGTNRQNCKTIEVSPIDDVDEIKTPVIEKGMLLTLLYGGSGGMLANYFGLPGGGLIGAMVVTALLSIIGLDLNPPPKGLIDFALVGLGGIIGLTFTPSIIGSLQEIIIPAAILSILMVLSGVLLGYVMHWFFHWDLTTALLACAPAGVSQMAAVALDMDADALIVGLIHAMRLLGIIIIYPLIIASLILK